MVRKRRVLVLDDHEALRAALRRVLAPYDVTLCATIADARARLLGERFDAVVSDIELPDGSGLDLFDEVARHDPDQAARYVFVSGSADAPGVKERLEKTGAPYFTKPFDVKVMLALVASIARAPV